MILIIWKLTGVYLLIPCFIILFSTFVNRGAELVNMNLIRRVEEMRSCEESVLNNIKNKMDRIKARQAKLQEKAIMETTDHYISKI